jgi:hypothetical protein
MQTDLGRHLRLVIRISNCSMSSFDISYGGSE